MYIALAILFAGILVGRLFREHLSRSLLQKLISAAIFLLLFLLGVSIGKNSELLSNLPVFGLQAIIIMLLGVAGSIACCMIITPFFRKKSDTEQEASIKKSA